MKELKRDPKHAKAFSRRILMDIAKVLRNTAITTAHREIVTRALANYFEREDQFFDRKTFNQIANGTLEYDVRTVAYSPVQEKPNETTL
jgi:predicted nucleic-acid-binding protein